MLSGATVDVQGICTGQCNFCTVLAVSQLHVTRAHNDVAVTCNCQAHLEVKLLCQAAGLPLHGRDLVS